MVAQNPELRRSEHATRAAKFDAPLFGVGAEARRQIEAGVVSNSRNVYLVGDALHPQEALHSPQL
jgi:hypothetical protein